MTNKANRFFALSPTLSQTQFIPQSKAEELKSDLNKMIQTSKAKYAPNYNHLVMKYISEDRLPYVWLKYLNVEYKQNNFEHYYPDLSLLKETLYRQQKETYEYLENLLNHMAQEMNINLDEFISRISIKKPIWIKIK